MKRLIILCRGFCCLFVALVLTANSSIGSPPSYEFKSIHIAAREGNLLKVKFLVALNPSCVNEPIIVSHWSSGSRTVEHTPLLEAAENGHLDVVKYLVEHGARVNVGYKDAPFAFPLSAAARGGYLDIVSYLIEKGADVNVFGLAENPLYYAATNGQLEAAEFLLAKGAIVNPGGRKEVAASLLLGAVGSGNPKMVEWLLIHGVDVNAAGSTLRWPSQNMMWGKATALHLAVARGDLSMVQLLLKYGANVDLVDAENRTAADVAREYGRNEIAPLLPSTVVSPVGATSTTQGVPSATQNPVPVGASTVPVASGDSALLARPPLRPPNARFGLQWEKMPFDQRKLLVDTGADNIDLPELEAKVRQGAPLTEQERDLLRKLKKNKERYFQQLGLYQ